MSNARIRALQVIFGLCRNRSCWRRRAVTTRSRICADVSPVRSPAISRNLTGGTSTCKSMRSSNGPEILPRYFCISRGELCDSPGIFPSGVRDVAFLRPQYNRRSQEYCTSLDTEFSNRQGAYDLGPAPQEKTILGGRPTAGSRCKIRG